MASASTAAAPALRGDTSAAAARRGKTGAAASRLLAWRRGVAVALPAQRRRVSGGDAVGGGAVCVAKPRQRTSQSSVAAAPRALVRRAMRSTLTTSPPQRPAEVANVTAPPPQPRAPAPALYKLIGGGSGVGKRAYSGSEAHFVRRLSKQGLATSWGLMRLVTLPAATSTNNKLGVGGELLWARTHLREVLPGGSLAASPPPSFEAMAAASGAVPAQQAPAHPPATAALLPPLPPPLSAPLPVAVRNLVVLFDLESCAANRYAAPGDVSSWSITEFAATALCLPLASNGWATLPDGRISALLRKTDEFAPKAAALCGWLSDMSTAAGGAPITMLAHNGAACDWPVLTAALQSSGMELPACVTALGCSRTLFVAELHAVLGRKWSMQRVYDARFSRAVIPDAHTAAGDVSAMERIFQDVCTHNSAAWVQRTLEQRCSVKTPACYVDGHVAKYGRSRKLQLLPVPPSPPPLPLPQPTSDVLIIIKPPSPLPAPRPRYITPEPVAPVSLGKVPLCEPEQKQVQASDALDAPEVRTLASTFSAAFTTPVRDRAGLWRALRAAAALPRALRAAAPALERAARDDRSRAPVAAARALLAGVQRLRPMLARALGEAQ